MRGLLAGQAWVQAVKRNMDLMSAAGHGLRPRVETPEPELNIVMMGYFEKEARHEICYDSKKSDPLSSHLCPYLER